jgi:hypothetical protein
MLRRLLIVPLVLALICCSTPLLSYAQSASICHDTVQVIEHPEQYAIDTVIEKVKKDGVSCLFHPSCCTPGWQLDPVCYVANAVQHKRTISAEWKEFKTITTCQDYPIDKALKTLFRDFTRPETVVSKISGLDPFFRVLASEIAVARAAAQPLPEDLKKELIDKFRSLHVKTTIIPPESLSEALKRGGVPPPDGAEPTYREEPGDFYAERDAVNSAVWMQSDNPAAAPLWALKSFSGAHAITFENVIIVGPDMLNATGCDRLAYWAHEITHVRQYNQNGLEGFLNPYIVDGINSGYCGIQAEIIAFRVENEFRKSCNLSENQCH